VKRKTAKDPKYGLLAQAKKDLALKEARRLAALAARNRANAAAKKPDKGDKVTATTAVSKAVQALRDEAKDIVSRIKARRTEKNKEVSSKSKALGTVARRKIQRRIDILDRENREDATELKKLRGRIRKAGQAKTRKELKGSLPGV